MARTTKRHATEFMNADQYDAWLEREEARIETTVFHINPIDNELIKNIARHSIHYNPDVIAELLRDALPKTEQNIIGEAWATLRNGVKQEDGIIASVARRLLAAIGGKPTRKFLLEAASQFKTFEYASESVERKLHEVRLRGRDDVGNCLERQKLEREIDQFNEKNKLAFNGVEFFTYPDLPEELATRRASLDFARQGFFAYRTYLSEAEDFLFHVTLRVGNFICECENKQCGQSKS